MSSQGFWFRTTALVTALAVGFAPAAAQDAKQQIEEIGKEFQQELKDLRQLAKDAPDPEASGALYKDFYSSVVPEYAARYAAIARTEKGTDLGLTAWSKVVDLAAQSGKGELAREAVDALLADHLQSESLVNVAQTLRYNAESIGEDVAIAGLKSIAEKTPHRMVRAAAKYHLGAVLGEDRPAGDPRLAEAKAVFTELKDYGDVPYSNGKSYAQAAEAFLFALENLTPGRPCPDFAAVDAEGASFKLSDYKGKVVLVDFWGFW